MKDDPYPLFVPTMAALGYEVEREYRFCQRRWVFDYCIPSRKVAVEVEGGIWVGGGHARPANIERDIEKYNEAQILGWLVVRVRPQDMAAKGNAVGLALRALETRGER